MPSTTAMAGAFLLAGFALATPLTTLEVCQEASPTVSACTVTKQHQSVSTCFPTSTKCETGTSGTETTCSTDYSYSTWAYVSTVIPCGWNGTAISSCTVTKTDQDVLCSATATTITSVIPTHTGYKDKNSTELTTDYTTAYTTISKQWVAPYNKLGPLAIPGYDGCELCTDCAPKGDGSRSQHYQVTECSSSGDKAADCSQFGEDRISTKAAPGSTRPVSAVNSVKTSVASAGTYTFTFTNTAPAAVVTHGGQTYTVPPKPWFHYATRTCGGPTKFDFTTTVTKTISVYPPFKTSTGTAKTTVDPQSAMHWGDWNFPAEPTNAGQPGKPGQQGPWGGAKGPNSESFVIPVNSGSGSKYSKPGNQYVGFPNGGDDASIVSGKENAAKFYFDADGNLMFGGKYVSTSTSAGYLVFELSSGRPSGPKFSIGHDGSFNLPGAGFCATDDTFFITYAGSPNGCKPVTCNVKGGDSSSTKTVEPTGNYEWGAWPAAETTSSSSSSTYSSSYSSSTTSYSFTYTSSTFSTVTTTSGAPGTTTPGGTTSPGGTTTGTTTGAPGTTTGGTGTTTGGTGTTTGGTGTTTGGTGTTTGGTGTTTSAQGTTTTPPTTTPGGTTTTPGSTTTTTGGNIAVSPANPGQIFAISVNLRTTKRKRAESLASFSGDSATIVGSGSEAAAFQINGGVVTLANSDVTFGVTATSPDVQSMKKLVSGATNAMSGGWSLAGGSLTYPGATFCVRSGAFSVVFGGVPSDCVVADLVANANPDAYNLGLTAQLAASTTSTTTTTTTTTATSTSATGTTTTTPPVTTTTATATTTTSEEPSSTTSPSADPSADLDLDDPVPTARPRKRGGVLRRRQHV